jgi:drug/metabolite transporter (DMT)-like permease
MLYFITTLIIFASMEVVSKPLMGHIDPFVLTFWRFVTGFLFFFFYPGMKKRFVEISNFSVKDWTAVAILGILNSFLAMSLLQLSVQHCSAATSAAIFCSNPVFVMIMSNVLGSEKFSIKKGAGMFFGISAVVLIMSEKGFVINSGALFALSGAVVFAAYTVLSKRTVSRIDPFAVNLTSFFSGLVANFIFMSVSGILLFPAHEFFNISRTLVFLYLGIVVTGIGYITFLETIKRFTAVSASIIFMLKPAVAVLFSAIFLDEIISWPFFTGLLMLTAAIALIFSDRFSALAEKYK